MASWIWGMAMPLLRKEGNPLMGPPFLGRAMLQARSAIAGAPQAPWLPQLMPLDVAFMLRMGTLQESWSLEGTCFFQ